MRRLIVESLIGIVVTATILTVLGPYGTAMIPLPQRALVWFSSLGACWFVFVIIQQLLRRALPAPRWPLAVPLTLSAVLGSLPTTAIAIWLNPLALPPYPGPAAYLLAYLSVLFIAALITATFVLVRRRVSPPAAAGNAPAAAPKSNAAGAPSAAGFLGRNIPRFAHAKLIAIEAEDHYLRLHTDLGSDLVLMRLRDAVAQLGGHRGLQVHRSFWVAEDAVVTISRANGRLVVVMSSGLNVPVSRGYAAQVEAAGWLDRFGPATAKSLA
jgi:hypothetical protein